MINRILEITIDDIKKCFLHNVDENKYECLICGEEFEEGEIFTYGSRMYEASRAIKEHIKLDHGGTLSNLLKTDKKYTGITEKQKSLLEDIAKGLSDKEIASKNGVAASTIRHQRFMFREKAKQAKMFLAVYESVEKSAKTDVSNKLLNTHSGAKMLDERYILTEEENKKILDVYFEDGNDLKLKKFPSKEKKKIAVLREITLQFDKAKKYSEKELNEIIRPIHLDIATIRRYLIEYGFFERTRDCKEYWIKK